VQGAAFLGYKLVSRSTDRVEVEHHGQLWTYDVLAVLEFNSDRKRMSIICRTPEGSLKLFCKGADLMIYQRLARTEDQAYLSAVVREHLVGASACGWAMAAAWQRRSGV
jgi:phospholipid-transporting ATPase